MIRHTITMPEPMSEDIMNLVSAGQYGGISEYFRDLVRRDLERREEKEELKAASILALKEMIAKGEASGMSPRSLEDIWEEAKKNSAVQK